MLNYIISDVLCMGFIVYIGHDEEVCTDAASKIYI